MNAALRLGSALLLALLAGLRAVPAAADPPPGPAAPAPAEVARLVEQLGAPDFEVREDATRRLLELGSAARPALERTMRESPSLEARWRAEQILRRLDQEGEKPVEPPRGPRTAPPTAPAPGPAWPRLGPLQGPPPGLGEFPSIEDLLRRIEREFGRVFPLGRGFDERPGDPSAGGVEPTRFEVPGLRLEIGGFGLRPSVTLRVLEEGTAGEARVAETLEGRSLEEILERKPALREHAGMPELRRQWEAWRQRPENRLLFPFENFLSENGWSGGFSFRSTSGPGESVSITHDAQGVHVQVTRTDERGQRTTREYRGESLAQLKRDHPELEDVLPDVSIRLSPPVVFTDRRPDLPPPPAPPVTPRAAEDVVFGVGLVAPEPALAHQLRLREGVGLLIVSVKPESQAEAMGVRPHDLLLAVDEVPARDRDEVARRLRAAAAANAPLRLSIIREGQRMDLTR
jgi:hypothetical protein